MQAARNWREHPPIPVESSVGLNTYQEVNKPRPEENGLRWTFQVHFPIEIAVFWLKFSLTQYEPMHKTPDVNFIFYYIDITLLSWKISSIGTGGQKAHQLFCGWWVRLLTAIRPCDTLCLWLHSAEWHSWGENPHGVWLSWHWKILCDWWCLPPFRMSIRFSANDNGDSLFHCRPPDAWQGPLARYVK